MVHVKKQNTDDLSAEDSKYELRYLELQAYTTVLCAVRSQGVLDDYKKSVLEHLRAILSIPLERHKAEVRKVAVDANLSRIAKRLNPLCDCDFDWLSEGRRAVGVCSPSHDLPPMFWEEEGASGSQAKQLADRLASAALSLNRASGLEDESLFKALAMPVKHTLPEVFRVFPEESLEWLAKSAGLAPLKPKPSKIHKKPPEKVKIKEETSDTVSETSSNEPPEPRPKKRGRPKFPPKVPPQLPPRSKDKALANMKQKMASKALSQAAAIKKKSKQTSLNKESLARKNQKPVLPPLRVKSGPHTINSANHPQSSISSISPVKSPESRKISSPLPSAPVSVVINMDSGVVPQGVAYEVQQTSPTMRDVMSGMHKSRTGVRTDMTLRCARVQPFEFAPAPQPGIPKPPRGNPDKRTRKLTSVCPPPPPNKKIKRPGGAYLEELRPARPEVTLVQSRSCAAGPRMLVPTSRLITPIYGPSLQRQVYSSSALHNVAYSNPTRTYYGNPSAAAVSRPVSNTSPTPSRSSQGSSKVYLVRQASVPNQGAHMSVPSATIEMVQDGGVVIEKITPMSPMRQSSVPPVRRVAVSSNVVVESINEIQPDFVESLPNIKQQ